MTRIVRKPLDEDLLRLSKTFDDNKSVNHDLTLTQFCKANRVPYQALRALRANMVRTHRGVIQYSRSLKPKEKKSLDQMNDQIVNDEEPIKKKRKSREKHIDVFDELEKAYAMIGRLVVGGAKL